MPKMKMASPDKRRKQRKEIMANRRALSSQQGDAMEEDRPLSQELERSKTSKGEGTSSSIIDGTPQGLENDDSPEPCSSSMVLRNRNPHQGDWLNKYLSDQERLKKQQRLLNAVHQEKERETI